MRTGVPGTVSPAAVTDDGDRRGAGAAGLDGDAHRGALAVHERHVAFRALGEQETVTLQRDVHGDVGLAVVLHRDGDRGLARREGDRRLTRDLDLVEVRVHRGADARHQRPRLGSALGRLPVRREAAREGALTGDRARVGGADERLHRGEIGTGRVVLREGQRRGHRARRGQRAEDALSGGARTARAARAVGGAAGGGDRHPVEKLAHRGGLQERIALEAGEHRPGEERVGVPVVGIHQGDAAGDARLLPGHDGQAGEEVCGPQRLGFVPREEAPEAGVGGRDGGVGRRVAGDGLYEVGLRGRELLGRGFQRGVGEHEPAHARVLEQLERHVVEGARDGGAGVERRAEEALERAQPPALFVGDHAHQTGGDDRRVVERDVRTAHHLRRARSRCAARRRPRRGRGIAGRAPARPRGSRGWGRWSPGPRAWWPGSQPGARDDRSTPAR